MADKVGIVTALDGTPISQGEIAGPVIPGHDHFQNGQKFIAGGGRRGLQEQVLLSASWNLNPWFAVVEQVPMTEIPIGHVGVVVSFVGEAHEDVSGLEPIVGNYFRNSAQAYTVLDFLSARSERQLEAADHIGAAVHAYDVQAIDTLIGDITPPPALMETQTDRKTRT